jgi:pimeloyl-ACP methyl ester carboxylesterase
VKPEEEQVMVGIRTALVLSAIAASGLTYARYSREIHAAKKRVSLGGNVVNTACGSIHFADVGQGKPLLLVHGAGGGFDQGLVIAKQNGISERDYRIIAPSRFGYLQTPLPSKDASPAAQADAHAYLLDALGVREKVAVMGTSAGALFAMQFAIKYPEKVSALVLLVPDSWAPPESRGPAAVRIAGSQFILNVVLRLDLCGHS